MITRSSALILIACQWLLSGAIASAQTGTGLTGKYYDTETFGTLKTTRTDATVNFNWATAIPAGTTITSADTFSVVWSGQIEPGFSENHTFYLTADDSARLWVDDQMIVSRTFYQGNGEMRGQIRLKAGHKANIRIEYVESTGNASVKLEWASASQPRQLVPAARLYPTTEVPSGGSLMREVWMGLAGSNLATLQADANFPSKPASRDFITTFESIARNWEDSFGTRVTGYIRAPMSGSYTFAVSGDETVELYLSTDSTAANKSRIANTAGATGVRQWDAQPSSQQSAARTLVAGRLYYVELLHKESTGADHWSVGWKQPGDSAFSVIPGTVLVQPGTDTPQPASANIFDTLATEQPRLGISRERLIWMKQMYANGTGTEAFKRAQAVINSANSDVTNVVTSPVIQRGNQARIQRLAFAYWVTNESKYLDAAWTAVKYSIDHGDWKDPWRGVENGVIATGYDWLYPFWTQARRDEMVNCMVNKGFGAGWVSSYTNNIGIILNAGHLMALLATGTANEAAAENKVPTAVSRLASLINQFEANGGEWVEGPGYGILSKLNLAQALPAMEMSLGSTWGLSKVRGLSTAAREPLTIASNTRHTFTFADVGTPSEAAIGWANWFARRYDALEVFDYSRQIGNSPLNALTLPETTIAPAAVGRPPDTAFHGAIDSNNYTKHLQDVVTLRENWSDSKATFLGAKGGGFCGSSHTMLDGGTFQLVARGARWFWDLSSESYDVPNHNTTEPNPNGADRWDYYRNRAEGHNCLVINPNSGPDRTIDNKAYLINFQAAPAGKSFAVYDLTQTIVGSSRVQRGFQLLGNRKQILVQDEIVMPTASTAWWFAHFNNTNTSATISENGSVVTLQQGSERLWGKILSGGGTWNVRTATPLPTSPNPSQASPNPNYSKLAINLSGVTNTTLAVWFVPLAPGEAPPTTSPAITPLNTWNLVDQNDAPIVQNSGASSSGGAPVDVDLRNLATDDWTPSTQLTFAVSGAIGGSVALQPDGYTARYTPTSGFTGEQSFSFTATDGDGGTSNLGTITIGTTPVVTNWTSAVSGSWSAGTNWQNGTAPVSGRGSEIQFFNGQTLGAVTVNTSNNLAAGTQLNRLMLGGTGAATSVVNLSGSSLKFVRNGAASPEILLSGATAGFRYNVANDLVLDETTTVTASGTGTFALNGAISGAGSITRSGSTGTLVLGGNNSYAGTTTNSAGTLQIGNDGATGTLGAGPVVNNGQLRIDRTGTLDIPNDISGSGSLLLHCPGTSDLVRLSGDNTFTGEVRLSGGMLRLTHGSQLGAGTKNVVIDGATASLRLDGSAGDIEIPDSFRIFSNITADSIINEAGTNVISGPVSLAGGSGGRRITSLAGTLVLDGGLTTNTFGRTIDFRGAGNGVVNGPVANGSSINTLGTVSKSEAGTWTFNGDNNFAGGTTVNAGRLVINGSHASGAVSVASGATLAGRGSLTAATTVNGILAPGDGIGTMNFASTLSFGSSSRVQWELGGNSLTAGDRAISAAAVSVTSGAKIDVVLNSAGSETTYVLSFWRSSRTWPVVSGSSLTGSFSLGTVSGDAAGHATATYGSFSLQHTATGVNLVWTPVPGFPIIDEPVVTITSPSASPASLPNAESSMRLTATAAGGGVINYVWSHVIQEGDQGGSVTFANANAPDTRVMFSEPGTYTLRCTATNEAVSRSSIIVVLVGQPATVALQQDLDGYSHRASYIQSNSTGWNHGANPQLRVGKNTGNQRAVMAFDLNVLPPGSVVRSAKLDLWTDSTVGVGTVSALELRRLTRGFVEGTGNGSSSSNGSGSGVTWASTNGSTGAADLWNPAGGSFDSTVLASAPGFDTSLTGLQRSFASSQAFASAAQAALDGNQSLDLILLAPVTESGTTNGYTNLKSNEHPDAEQRPLLTIDYTLNSLPQIHPGTAIGGGVGFPLPLNGSVVFANSSQWSLVSGPGSANFANAASPVTTVTFSAAGSYLLRLSAANSYGEASRELTVNVGILPDGFAAWQSANWPSVTDPAIIGPNSDPDGDGVTNAIEFNAGTNPTLNTSVPAFVWNRNSSGDWNNAGSWQLGAVPPSNAVTRLEFFTGSGSDLTIAANNNIGTFTLKSLSLNGSGLGTTNLTGGTLAFATGGTLDLNSDGIAYQISNAVVLNAATTFGGTSLGTLQLGALGGTGALTKTGPSTVSVLGSHSGSGHSYVNEGSLRFGGGTTGTGNHYLSGGTLGYDANTTGVKQVIFGATAGDTDASTLDIAADVSLTGMTVLTTGTVNFLKIAAGKTLTLNGGYTAGGVNNGVGNSNLTASGAGSMVMNFGTNAIVRRGSVLDLSALGGLTMTGTNLNIGDLDNYTTLVPAKLVVPANGPATINATTLNLSSAGVGGGLNRGESASFVAPAGTGLLTIRGAAGGSSTANLLLGKHVGSSDNESAILFDTTGHPSDIRLGTLEISRCSGTNKNGDVTSTFLFNNGTLSVANPVTMGFCEGAPNNVAQLSLAGGTSTFSNGITMASNTTASTNVVSSATLNISGTANVTSGTITLGALTGTASGRSSTAVLNVTGGTLTMTGDIVRGDASGTGTSISSVNLSGGVIDMGGFNLGSAGNPLPSVNITGGTLKNVGSINGSSGFTKTGSGSLTLDGLNQFTGDLTVSTGSVTLADDARFRFAIGGASSNKITGPGSAALNGDFYLDLANAAPANGKTWTLVDVTSRTYGPTFSVKSSIGDFTNNAGAWTLVEPNGSGDRTWTFSQTTGVLSVSVAAAAGPNWISAISGNWSAAANWTGGVPASGASNSVRFFNGQTPPAGSTITATNDIVGVMQLNKLELTGTGTSATTVNLAGNALNFVANGATAPKVLLASGVIYQIANHLTLSTATTFESTAAGTTILSGVIDGSGGIIRDGAAGTLVLTGANTFTGPTTINAGTLAVGATSGTATSGTLSTSSSIVNHGTLIFRRTDAADLDLAGSISGSGTVLYQGSGVSSQSRYTVNNASSYQGGTTVTSARAAVTNATGLGSGPVTVTAGAQVVPNAAITIANPFTLSGDGWVESAGALGALRLANGSQLSGPITLAANTRVGANTGTATLSGGVSGPFRLEIGEDSTPGTVVLSGTNTYSGDTLVSFGTFDLAATGSLLFKPAANGVCNRITGTATANLKGSFVLDLSAAALVNGNSWTLVNNTTLNETYAATFSVAGFTESSNVWTKVDGTRTWTFSEATGVLSLAVGSSTITTPAFDSWILAYPDLSDITQSGDPDKDGIANLLEYVLNGDPSVTDLSILPKLDASGANFVFSFTRLAASAANSTQIFQYGTDLATWTDVPIVAGGAVAILANTPQAGLEQISITLPKGTHTKLVGRLKVSTP